MVTSASENSGSDAYDMLVVGSGAAGSLMAAKAAAAGKRVLILEAGPARNSEDLINSQLWARRLKWAGTTVEEEGNLKIGHGFNVGWGTGGSAKHHYAVWPRLHKGDFKTKTLYDEGIDWPIEYGDLQSFYDKVQNEVGMSGDAAAEIWRPPGEKYPLPPLPVFAQGKAIQKGFEALDMNVAPIPMAINSQPYKGRKACMYDGWCDAGCPIGALANPLVTYLKWALEDGAELRNDAAVTRIVHDQSGRKVTGAIYHDADGEERIVYGDTVVLAAFTVQNARLLLASASDKHPNGLSNTNDHVGRYLMTHASNSVYGLFPEDTQPYMGPTGGQLICHDRYKDRHKDEAYGAYQWLIANALKPNDLLGIANTRPDIYGPALEEFMTKASARMGNMVFVGEDIPLPENRVELSTKRDQYGMPLPKAIHNITAPTEAMCNNAVAEGLAIFKAAGVREPWQGPRFGMHIMGGTIMGDKPETSVTDSYGRCHELDNLYVTGCGLFPTSGAVNPTFTINALTLRTAEHILDAHA
ncbi:MAG: GMC family oxidoreductase [Pseudomonadota bacterium]